MYIQRKNCHITPHNRTDDDSTNKFSEIADKGRIFYATMK